MYDGFLVNNLTDTRLHTYQSITPCQSFYVYLFLLTGTPDGHLFIYDAQYGHGKSLLYHPDAHDLGVTCCAFSPEPAHPASTCMYITLHITVRNLIADKFAKVQRVLLNTSQRCVWKQSEFYFSGMASVVSEDSGCFFLMASGGFDNMIKLWDFAAQLGSTSKLPVCVSLSTSHSVICFITAQ